MSADWREVETLFFDALAAPENTREAWLRERTAGRDELLREVLSLLEAHHASEAEPRVRRAGAYVLEKLIARGGMGEVWLASRDDGQFDQKVAVKLVRTGLDSRELVARFQRERQLLARLNHPNIARLIDGGVTTDGRPFLAMEYVEGEPILSYVEKRGLSTSASVKLFQQLLGAVGYAHRNLIVHRDLKPSNVLVDASGAPKLLDFGIARLIEDGDTLTATVLPMLTPRYASPEQLRGEPVTTASDVYSLGVLLYEILTGELPYDVRGGTQAQLISAIHTQEARPASRAGRKLSPDLDAVLMKALEKDPVRRYPSVEAFSADLENQQRGRPVSARRQTRLYRVERYLRRHSMGVAAAAAVVLALIGATAISVRAARVASRQRERAERVQHFVIDVLTAANPGNRASGMESGADAKLVDVMAAASARLGSQFADDPGIQAELHAAIGRADIGLGKYKEAEAEIQAAIDHVNALDTEPAEKARVLHAAARLDYDEGRTPQALERQQEAVRLFSSSREAASDPRTLSVMLNNLATMLFASRRKKEAAEALDSALALLEKMPQPPAFELGVLHYSISTVQSEFGQLDKAEREARAAVEAFRRLPLTPVNLGMAEANLGVIERWTGRQSEALTDLEQGAADAIRIAGRDHPRSIGIRVERDYQWALMGRTAEAEADLRNCLDAIGKARGGINTGRALGALGLTRTLAGAPAEGEKDLRRSLRWAESWSSPLSIALVKLDLGECLRRQGRIEEARPLFEQALEGSKNLFGDGAWITQEASRRLSQLAEPRATVQK